MIAREHEQPEQRHCGRKATSRGSRPRCARVAMRSSRGSGSPTGMRRPRRRLRRRHDRRAGGAARRERARRRHPEHARRGRQRARARRSACRTYGSRKATPRDLRRPRRRQLRPGRQHLRRDVRAAAVRRRQGARARRAARRPDRDGQLDPRRPDARRADPADQLRLLAAAAGRVRQPDDVGRRERRDRAVHRGRRARGRDLVRARHLHVRLIRARRRSSSPSSGSTTGRR